MERAQEIQAELEQLSTPEKKETLPRYFKAVKGGYGEGDRFLGVTVPNIRSVARKFKNEPMDVISALLESEWHECRLCALLMLVDRFKKGSAQERQDIFDFYLKQTARINNWDLVDLSAPTIVGEYVRDKPRDILRRLAKSSLLWNQRIAVVATLPLIKSGDFTDILELAPLFFKDPHDLMQKATGWMLREVGNKNKKVLVTFLTKHSKVMPRTMLRYSIEKLPPAERRHFMSRT